MARQPARGLATDEEALFEALRTLRRALAQDQGVPPYIIFHDTTLQEMARTCPAHLEQLRRIPGVGAQKLKRYGARFLDEIAKYARGRPPGDDPGDPIDAP
ncbi:MAG: HRDC domain-containing protein [Acidiferrobacteraceae bacterium]